MWLHADDAMDGDWLSSLLTAMHGDCLVISLLTDSQFEDGGHNSWWLEAVY